jgi:N-ethylmaleimide reductase
MKVSKFAMPENASGDTDALFMPVRIGQLELRNRVVMSPMTRNRAGAGDVPQPIAAEYYRQRATAGLIVTEASQISPQGKGYPGTPGIYSREQIAGWHGVTDAVHRAGGRIFLQLWHVGRISHPSLQRHGALPVAPSAIMPAGGAKTAVGLQPFVTPRALETAEMPGIVESYRRAALNAKEAGFDGVEIHAANGYLLDQFLRDGTNHRTDAYGGSVENRARLLLEAVDVVSKAVGAGRVGVRLSPIGAFNDMKDSDPAALFLYVAEKIGSRGLAYLHVYETDPNGFDWAALKQAFGGRYIANGAYDGARAAAVLSSGRADLVAFGVPFIGNPDLVARLKTGAPLAGADSATFYGGDYRGYTDYPALA